MLLFYIHFACAIIAIYTMGRTRIFGELELLFNRHSVIRKNTELLVQKLKAHHTKSVDGEWGLYGDVFQLKNGNEIMEITIECYGITIDTDIDIDYGSSYLIWREGREIIRINNIAPTISWFRTALS